MLVILKKGSPVAFCVDHSVAFPKADRLRLTKDKTNRLIVTRYSDNMNIIHNNNQNRPTYLPITWIPFTTTDRIVPHTCRQDGYHPQQQTELSHILVVNMDTIHNNRQNCPTYLSARWIPSTTTDRIVPHTCRQHGYHPQQQTELSRILVDKMDTIHNNRQNCPTYLSSTWIPSTTTDRIVPHTCRQDGYHPQQQSELSHILVDKMDTIHNNRQNCPTYLSTTWIPSTTTIRIVPHTCRQHGYHPQQQSE
ncbi:hypothetical protein RRG08_054088 [Elysia crispata]|uniref:Uncharacterized protein n=1 Tax=Elysia crispata TaxID=231223 RepID=A0AAE1DEK9_9GAST|nr:hypothetical protein RRG08_054088 [Elysia crispata]